MTTSPALGIVALGDAYRAETTTPVDVVDAALARIDADDGMIGSFTEVYGERARREAAEATAELRTGAVRGPLHGIPVGVKELFAVDGGRAYGGSLVELPPPVRESSAVRRLRQAGAIVVGATRSHEFAWGITTQHARLGSTKNPRDPARVPGGSSGGSAAAVAAGMVPGALGTDTGGSVRIPAAFCGVVGFKPSRGTIARDGIVPLAPSLDHVGVLACDVASARLLVEALMARGPSVAASMPVKGVRLGIPEAFAVELRDDVAAGFARATDVAARALDAASVPCSWPVADEVLPLFATIQMAEAYHVHAAIYGTYPARAADYGDDVRSRLERAAAVSHEDYLAARIAVEQLVDRVAAVFGSVDVVLTPVAATGPSSVDDPDTVNLHGRPMAFRDAVMPFTMTQNLAGLPACTVPAGVDDDGLPVGLQITGPVGADDMVLAVAAAVEDALAS